MRIYAILAAFLFAVSLSFAADEGASSMQAFCMNLLNMNAENNTTIIIEEQNETLNFSYSRQHDEALASLVDANASIANIKSAGFPSQQAGDIYLTASQWFDGQAAIELSGSRGDYRFTFEKVNEIKTIERESFSVNDDLRALGIRLSNATIEVDRSPVIALQKQAEAEFVDGRFEEARRLVDQAYNKISDLEAETSRSKTLAESAKKNIENFLQENWKTIAAIAFVAIVVFFVFQKQIRKFTIQMKINALNAEKVVLDSMLKNLQREYFESGKVNELSYHIKTKKFGDIMRNINRQIPLLKEELKKL